jgi:uncharacterized iron-regulated membrane protein
VRKVFFNLHLYAGLAAAVFILIFGLTGSIMAFETELDHMLHWRLSYVTPNGPARSLANLAGIVAQRYPGQRIGGYGVPADPGLAYSVSIPHYTLYINQYTGELLGEREGGIDMLGRIHQLHLRLLMLDSPRLGKSIMSWAGVAMLFLLLSGVYLWWPYRRFAIKWSGGSRRVWFDVHAVVGIFSFLFLFVLTLTGIMIGFEEKAVPLFYKMTNSSPSRIPRVQAAPPPGAQPIGPDSALEIARSAVPGAAPFQISIPGPKGAYNIRARFPEDRTPGGRSAIVIDQYTGAVVFAEGSRRAPAGARMVIANRAIHTGDIFGIPSKALMSLACLMAVAQVISGVTLWWKMRKKAADSYST